MDDNLDFNVDDLDLSAFDSDSQGPADDPAPVQEAVSAESSGNPAWNEYLEKVPAGMHTLVKPAFEAWDQNVQKRFQEINQQWEPYKKFRDEQVDPEYLSRAKSFADQLQADPVAVYAQLHQYFQQSPEHLQQLVQMGIIPDPNAQQAQPNAEAEVEGEDPFAEIKALKAELESFKAQQLEALQEQQVAQQFNQAYEQTVNAIETDFEQIEQRTGALPQHVKAEIVKQAQFMGQQSGKYVSVVEAAPHVFRFMQQARSGVKPAPRPVGSGSVPQSQSFDPVTASEAERVEYAKAIAAQYRD